MPMPLKWYFKIDKGRPLGPQIENNITIQPIKHLIRKEYNLE